MTDDNETALQAMRPTGQRPARFAGLGLLRMQGAHSGLLLLRRIGAQSTRTPLLLRLLAPVRPVARFGVPHVGGM